MKPTLQTAPEQPQVQRLPLHAVSKTQEGPRPIMTLQKLKAIRDELGTIEDGCAAVQRVLDQSEAVLRFDDLKDMPNFRAELTAELRAKLLRMTESLQSCLNNFRRRI